MGIEWIDLTRTETVLVGGYFALWIVFAILGFRRYWLVWLFRKGRSHEFPKSDGTVLPRVTVQLPVYNEYYVIRRLIRSVAALDYPRELLEIQVLDDSTDEAVEAAAEEVAKFRAAGVDIHHIRRPDRSGYKAGALEYGLHRAKGEILLIFDADFVPEPDLLRRAVPYIVAPEVGMVQLRWDHLNADYSLLSRIQSISLDGHFVIEHEARAKNGLFFNFNGTAGLWRKSCILDAGGWEHDTLTEDLDLSYRAQLKGWKFLFLKDVTCPAELPVDMKGFKNQQFRWVKGSVQVAKKLLPRIWSSDLPLLKKVESSVHLTHNMTYLLVFLLSVFLYPATLIRYTQGWVTSLFIELPLFFFATISLFVFYGMAQAGAHRAWLPQAKYFPALMSVAIGLSVNNTRAVLEGLFGKQTPFHRTPKYNILGRDGSTSGKIYRGMPSGTTIVELLLALYFVAVLVATLQKGLVVSIPFVLLFLFGYLYVGILSLDLSRPRRS